MRICIVCTLELLTELSAYSAEEGVTLTPDEAHNGPVLSSEFWPELQGGPLALQT